MSSPSHASRITHHVVVALLILASLASAAGLDGQLSLTLEDAVWQDGKGRGGEPTYLILDFVARDGRWERDVYGWAWNLNRADHFGTLRSVKTEGERLVLDVHMEIDGDPWVPGGLVDYHIDVSLKDGKATGTHSGTFRSRAMKGSVGGELAPLPRPREGWVPPEIGEHPRLLIRRSDIPKLKERAQADWGRPLIDEIKTKTGDGLCMGLMFALTGEQRYADLCRAAIEKEIPDKTGGPWNLGHEHGRRQQRVALTLDLAWDGLDEPFRALVAGYLWSYHSRLTLRPTTFSRKTNQAPGSNYMAFVVCGGITTQMAIWDAPGGFPVEPAPPRMERMSPPAKVATEDVPLVTVESGKPIRKWLFAGPFFVLKDRESHLVLREQVKGKPRYQHWGQDFLAAIGGVKAQVRAGTKVVYKGRACTFAPLDTGGKPIDVRAVHKRVPCTAGYYYTVLRVPKAGWYAVRLETAADEAREANPCMGDVSEKFTYGLVPFRLDATLYLAGRPFHEGDAVHLDAGAYPAMLRATTRQYQVRLLPRLVATTEAEAKASLAARKEQFDKHNALWEHYADAYYRRPMFGICRRKALRYDLYAQGSGGYKNEAGSYHNYTMGWTPLLNHTYAAYHGFPMPNNAMALPCWTVTGEGNPGHFAKGFSTVPDALKPAVLWAWEQSKRGREGQKSDPLMAFLNYPVGMEPKNPMGVLPNPYLDRQQGWCAFRSGWGRDDLMAEIHFKSFGPTGWNRACAGSFAIRGLGRTWAWRGDKRSGERYLEENVVLFPEDAAWINGPGRVTHFEGKPDGSGVISGTLDDALLGVKPEARGRARDYSGRLVRTNLRDLGLRHVRSFGVDYSGKCGAPGLFVVADRTKGGKRKHWQLLLPAGKQGEADVSIDGQSFTIKQKGASLLGTVVAPAAARLRLVEPGTRIEAVDGRGRKQSKTLEHQALWVEGGDDFLVVMTLQRGVAPDVAADGDGLDAKVTVGKRIVRFDGQKLVFGE